MIKFVFLIVAYALLIEGNPTDLAELRNAARSDNWQKFHSLINQHTLGIWPAALTGSVESLKPSDGTHVYGHSVSAYKEWHSDNDKQTVNSKGIEITNNDGEVTRRVFKP